MALRHYVLTLDGTAQRFTEGTGATPASVDDPLINNLIIQAGAANTGVVYIGGPAVSASVYMFSIPIPITSIPAAPFVLDLSNRITRPSHWYVIGTSGDTVHFGFAE